VRKKVGSTIGKPSEMWPLLSQGCGWGHKLAVRDQESPQSELSGEQKAMFQAIAEKVNAERGGVPISSGTATIGNLSQRENADIAEIIFKLPSVCAWVESGAYADERACSLVNAVRNIRDNARLPWRTSAGHREHYLKLLNDLHSLQKRIKADIFPALSSRASDLNAAIEIAKELTEMTGLVDTWTKERPSDAPRKDFLEHLALFFSEPSNQPKLKPGSKPRPRRYYDWMADIYNAVMKPANVLAAGDVQTTFRHYQERHPR
jgi:hypothetical protein